MIRNYLYVSLIKNLNMLKLGITCTKVVRLYIILILMYIVEEEHRNSAPRVHSISAHTLSVFSQLHNKDHGFGNKKFVKVEDDELRGSTLDESTSTGK